ncbi:hypothetical protein LINGRAHAP2_LOCUS34925 [Linum grandiflorum]
MHQRTRICECIARRVQDADWRERSQGSERHIYDNS